MTDSQPVIFADRVRTLTGNWVGRAGLAVHKLGIHPDWITWAGLALVALAALVIGSGQFQWGGVLLLLGVPLDALDGAVARAMQRKDKFGAVLDSTLDRYADGLIFGALCYHFAVQNQPGAVLLALAALAGAFAVSYVRARAGEAGLSVRIGLFDRLVRLVVMLIALLVPATLMAALWILALGTNFTALQRLWFVYKHISKEA
ncbi:MAG: CDP-alcohol phosphatidyltransferase family protein [Chloroflexi bacterium]|nr:CDP-alcohol phosphatidyltransferase family protein [Chloroflexota bacterium]